jgi:hypothetical protein
MNSSPYWREFKRVRSKMLIACVYLVCIPLADYFDLLSGTTGAILVVVGIACLYLLEVMKLEESEKCEKCGCQRPSGSPSLTGGPEIPRISERTWTCPECGWMQGDGGSDAAQLSNLAE